MAKTARPTICSDDIATSILGRIAEAESLSTICTPVDMPAKTTWYRWLAADEALAIRYSRAKADSADKIFEEISQIEKQLKAKEIDPQTARVLIDSKKWRASVLKPSTYGDRQTIKHDGGIDVRSIPDNMPDWLRDKAVASAIATGGTSIN